MRLDSYSLSYAIVESSPLNLNPSLIRFKSILFDKIIAFAECLRYRTHAMHQLSHCRLKYSLQFFRVLNFNSIFKFNRDEKREKNDMIE